MSHDPRALKYRPDIDGLRALAVLPVCFFHAGLPLFSGGFVGVSVFFVISGYLMASLIGRRLEENEFGLGDFYDRRVRRIFPALFVVLFFCVAAAAVIVPPKLFRDFGLSLFATVFFASNVVFWSKTANYFDAPSEWNPLLHTWSLSVEEQFYILFPLFLILVWRRGRSWRVGLTGAIAVLSFVLSVWGTANIPTATFYLLPTRAWELLLGALLALHAPRDPSPSAHSRRLTTTVGMIGLTFVLGSSLLFNGEMAFPGASALIPTLGAALLIYSGQDSLNPIARLLAVAPFVRIGKISYSLYLWHWPLLVFADKYKPFGILGPVGKTAVIALSCILAYVSWRWVEQPFRSSSSSINRRALFAAAATCMVLMGTFGALVQTSDGWTARFPGLESVSLHLQSAAEQRDGYGKDPASRKCFTDQPSDWGGDSCFLSRHAASNALLWGDSFAASSAPGFFHNEHSKLNVLQYTSPQCPPAIGYDTASRPQCAQFNGRLASIISKYRISTVIMAANWNSYFKRRKLSYEDIEHTLKTLRGLNVDTVVIGQSPVYSFVYPDEYFFKTFGSQLDERPYRASTNVDPDLNRKLARLAATDTFFDPMKVFCDGEGMECTFKQGRLYLFSDYGHYTHAGSKKVVDALIVAMNRTRLGASR